MLKHEDNPKPHSAAEARATPEELAAAITRLEARKDASQRQTEGTVAIGDIVQQLGLDATPEEVYAEVQAERARLSGTKNRRLSLRERLGLVIMAGALALSLVAYYGQTPHITDSQNTTAPAIRMVTPPVTDANTQRRHIQVDPDLLVGEASGKIVMLSEVSDNKPVHCTFDGDGLTFSPYSPDVNAMFWTLIKHDGKVYVRGRVQAMSAKVLAKDGTRVLSPSPNISSDGFVIPITMPLDGFDADEASPNDFHAQNIHLDKHAYEKW